MLPFLCFLVMCEVANSVDVLTEYGPVRGRTTEVYNGRNTTAVHEFRGIPFANDTSGPRRFRRPEAPEPWTEVYEAFEPGDACPQKLAYLAGWNPGFNSISENCLHLDIYSPNASSGVGSYPVMVWLYGGAYQLGANIQYPGHFLATHGVVVVVVNYRLGTFGFAYTGNDACPGNVGLWDQRMGLEFVVNNIGNFGGDPNRITVFGESAGAGSTSLMILSPQTKDLFQQAILESGAERNFWVLNRPESHPEDYTRQVASDLGCPVGDDFDMIECLREENMTSILYNTSMDCTPGYPCLGMAPVVDGEGGYLPQLPDDLRQNGDIMKGPIMSGIMQDDGALFLTMMAPETALRRCCNRSSFEDIVMDVVGLVAPRYDDQTSEDMFEALDWNYSQWPYVQENDRNKDALVRIVTDAMFGGPWDLQLKQHQSLADTYGFVFDYQSERSATPGWMGVTHAAELPYVWGYPMLQYNEHISNDSYLRPGRYTEEDVAFSYYFQELFTNFAKYGNPTFTDVEKPFGGSTLWPRFNTKNYQLLYLSNDVIDPVAEYRQKQYAFWTDYMKYITLRVPS